MRRRESLLIQVSEDITVEINQKRSKASATGWLVWPVAVDFCKYICEIPKVINGKAVLELGSGTGLVGIVSSLLDPTKVIISDLEDDLRMCVENVGLNEHRMKRPDIVYVRALGWGNTTNIESIKSEFGAFDVIMGSDIVYHQTIEILTGLVSTIVELSRASTEVFIAYEDREGMIEDETYFFGPLRERFGNLDVTDLSNGRLVYHFTKFLG